MNNRYEPVDMDDLFGVNRRSFLQALGCTTAGGLILGTPPLYGDEKQDKKKAKQPTEIKTNLDDFMKHKRTTLSIPGPFPGKVVKVTDPNSMKDGKFNAEAIEKMVNLGIKRLTGKTAKESFDLLFTKSDVVGLKVNPVGAPLISTRHEVTKAVIKWLVDSGLPKGNIIIWDRFESSLEAAGYTAKNYPGIQIVGLQNFKLDEEGRHDSMDRYDKDAYYFAEGIDGKVGNEKQNQAYLAKHVFFGDKSYFSELITKELTKIINIPGYKNTGNGVSMATKNIGYSAICNTARLHRPLFFRVCTEVTAAPWIRDKMVLNILDGIRAQYDGGPGMNAEFVYPNHSLYFATDPFALDMTGHRELLAKRKEMKVRISESPRYTQYLHDAEKLGLGIADPKKIELIEVKV